MKYETRGYSTDLTYFMFSIDMFFHKVVYLKKKLLYYLIVYIYKTNQSFSPFSHIKALDVPCIGGQVLGRSISADNQSMSVWTLVNNLSMSDQYASIYDQCKTDVIDFSQTTWDVTWESRPAHDDHGYLVGKPSKNGQRHISIIFIPDRRMM